ncbi:solute carrier organic anion transporter family member 74D-like [Schistocerca serialis cubense]|uniref:solute carrier organic anion transporter family member 74D-like n=1 Tax=Schistocerca serialis cubense TaxID=2023355 RepID=UPI00214EE0CC|nr:solute carrier organic anion transporter family member 74D-like [Schistocerca serialis cubense]XP_049940049.1 solute carrier organic anion transporter family member 74D-like [Schistocerca serialis cubense]XP_049940058.1 solute carrier organic anion transporter family member 74D-like [Schistocerca serialis cubense]XP_049940069.1 solute carrier organic anion transporter family member 74D-like [Schistocerca serialis cubense]
MTQLEMVASRGIPQNGCVRSLLREEAANLTTDDAPEEKALLPQADVRVRIETTAADLCSSTGVVSTSCGLGSWAPRWLQPLASDKAYAVLHGLLGMSSFVLGSYFVGTISTLEKRFNIPSRTTGLIYGASEMASTVSVLALSYLGSRGHRPRWVAAGTLLVALSCLLRLLPHALYGPGHDALRLTVEHGSPDVVATALHSGGGTTAATKTSLCGAVGEGSDAESCGQRGGAASLAPAAILFLANALTGVGNSLYYTLGIAYMDDNARRSQSPILLAVSQCLRMLGPTLGYVLASYALRQYVAPDLTPVIDSNDPRWIGAWWLAWAPMGVVELALAAALCLFPRQLPATARRKARAPTPPHLQQQQQQQQLPKTSFKDFRQAVLRLLRNKVLMLNTISSVCFMFGYVGYWTFMPKYMETQFRQSASRASLITGSVGLGFTAAGLVLSSVYISRAKPSARALAAWNVAVELLDVAVHLAKPFLGCPSDDLRGAWDPAHHSWNMTSECNAGCLCGPHVKYAPVCSADGAATFFSACHAGCQDSAILNGTLTFSRCSCIPGPGGGHAVEGACPASCAASFGDFLALHCLTSFLVATGRAGNLLLQFRCVKEADKALSIGFAEVLLCALAFAPGPVVYGALLDSACLVWGESCGERGSCWLYDGKTLRYLLNFTAAGFLIAGTLLDVGVWYHVKGLQIYDEDYHEKKRSKSHQSEASDKPHDAVDVT